MSIKTDIRQYLLSIPAITNIVGTRIKPMHLGVDVEGKKVPAITYLQLSPGRYYSHSGHSGLSHPVIQFSCWSYSFDECEELVNLLIEHLEGLKGNVSGRTVGGGFVNNQKDLYDPNTKLYHIPVDMEIFHN